jgi:hypothetical protein
MKVIGFIERDNADLIRTRGASACAARVALCHRIACHADLCRRSPKGEGASLRLG